MEKNRRNIGKHLPHCNSLFFKLALAVTIGINCMAICLFYVNFTISEKVFVDNFAYSQSKIFGQMENSFYKFYMDIAEISIEVSQSDTIREYLSDSGEDTAEEIQTIYSMQKQLGGLGVDYYDNLTMIIVGNNNKSYVYGKAELLKESLEEIRKSSFSVNAAKAPNELIYEYAENGFTASTINEPVVIGCRAIQNPTTKKVLGYVYLIMRDEDLRNYYDCFLSGTSDVVILNQDNKVISSNNKNYFEMSASEEERLMDVVTDFKEEGLSRQTRNIQGENITYMLKNFTSTNFTIVGMINPKAAFYQKYNMSYNVLLTVMVTVIIIIILFLSLRHQTYSLHKLINTMKNQKDGNLNGHLDLKGTEEIRELSNTFNEMMDNLNHYVNKVVETEQDKRNAEFRALQMQINPHYIYNTLASIKWLIMQGKSEEATNAMDAFIALLRNTISDKEEFQTVRQEIENLKYYVLINQTRYGNKVKVEFYVSEECMECQLPKMVLQPFIENAFFHAFPNERKGTIHIFMSRNNNKLITEIADDGIGIDPEQIESMLKQHGNKEHFTGIGINNVDERLKMIYGTEYGVHIESMPSFGTTVRVEIPIKS